MATLKEKDLASAIALNSRQPRDKKKNKKELLVSVGYAISTAEVKPGEIFKQKGVKEELFKLGFDVDNAKRVIAEIMNDETIEPNTRVNAAKEVFKVQGEYAPEKHLIVTKKLIQIDE